MHTAQHLYYSIPGGTEDVRKAENGSSLSRVINISRVFHSLSLSSINVENDQNISVLRGTRFSSTVLLNCMQTSSGQTLWKELKQSELYPLHTAAITQMYRQALTAFPYYPLFQSFTENDRNSLDVLQSH